MINNGNKDYSEGWNYIETIGSCREINPSSSKQIKPVKTSIISSKIKECSFLTQQWNNNYILIKWKHQIWILLTSIIEIYGQMGGKGYTKPENVIYHSKSKDNLKY